MKYLPLIWAGLWRKRTRTMLTLLSIVVAFLLFGMLQGINAAFTSSVLGANINRLYVVSKFSMTEALPLAQKQLIETVPGVTGVTYGLWFGSHFRQPRNFIISYPVDAATYFPIFSELTLPKDQLDTLVHTRTGAVIGVQLAKKYGWKIGDRVPLHTSIWAKADNSADYEFDIVGIFDHAEDTSKANSFFFNYDYLDEARAVAKGTVGWFIVQIDSPAHAAQISTAIDKLFANSPDETYTQSEKEYSQAYFKQFGDINLIVTGIVGAVFFTLLFLTGNTMMQSVRERTPELAVLKTLGFSNARLMAIIIAESLLLCVAAAMIGLAAAAALFPMLKSMLQVTQMPTIVVREGAALAVLLAVVTALPPALRAQRLKIVDALAPH